MIRRSLNPRFNAAVLAEIKITTIRDKAWPVRVPIMLYNWSGAAYRSKQVDVAAVMVEETGPIELMNDEIGFTYKLPPIILHRPLWQTEGFASREDMDGWFIPLIKPGQTVTKILHRFCLL